MQHDLFGSCNDLDLRSNFIFDLLGLIINHSTRLDKLNTTVVKPSSIFKHRPFWTFMTSGGQSVDLRSNLITHYGKICKRAIKCFFCVLLTVIVHELRRHLSENAGLSRITVEFDLWWPLVTSFLTLAKKEWNTFVRPSPKLSNAVSLAWFFRW